MELTVFVVLLAIAMPTVTSQIQNVRVPPGALVEFEFEFINPKPGQSGSGGSGGTGGTGGPTGQTGQTGSGTSQGMTRGQMQMLSQMMGGAGMSMAGSSPMGSGGPQMMGEGAPPMGGVSMMMGGVGQMMQGGMSGGGQMMAGASQPMSGGGQMMPGAGQSMSGSGQMMLGAGQPMSGGGQMMQGAGQSMASAAQAMASAAPGSPVQALLSNMVRMALALRRINGINQQLPPMEEPCPCDADCCSLPMEPRRVLPVLELPMTMHPGCCGCVECPLSLSPVISGMLQVARMAPMPPPRDL